VQVCRLVTLASNVQQRDDRHAVGRIRPQGIGSAGASLGWLLAGASAVVTSTWYVEHECKTVFFSKFYESMTLKGLDVAQALLATQRWLREATQLDYVRGWPREWQGISWNGNPIIYKCVC